MQDKREKEKRDREKHRERIRNQRKKEPNLNRREATRTILPSILIVCEGRNTEPDYFNNFRISSLRIKAVGEGYNSVSLVERAEELAGRGDFDQVWCVFDKDDCSDEDFNNAIKMAEEKGYKVGYSNQAFEYWLLLHFNDHQGGKMHRDDCETKLNEALKQFGIRYNDDGSKHLRSDFLDLLDGIDKNTGKPRVKVAITRAKRNLKNHSDKTPAQAESSTTVYQLVEVLHKYM